MREVGKLVSITIDSLQTKHPNLKEFTYDLTCISYQFEVVIYDEPKENLKSLQLSELGREVFSM